MKKQYEICRHEGMQSSYEDASLVLLGVPFDGTVSNRPGTRFGPAGVRQELDGLETYSPYLDKDLEDYAISDIGDLMFPWGDTPKVMSLIEKEVTGLLADDKKVMLLGGEHLISFPAVSAYVKRYPDLQVIHFDAHADLREHYLGEKLSHATVMRRIYETLTNPVLYQLGIRSGTKEEFAFAKRATHFVPFTKEGITEMVRSIKDAPVYVSIDLDVLDPSIFPGTGTPEPGGVTFQELLAGIHGLQKARIVGADVVELSPHYDASGVSNVVAAKVVRELALVMA